MAKSTNKNKPKKVKNEVQYLTINEAAEYNDVTRQAIYVAIKLNKLKAVKQDSRWTISLDDLNEYCAHKYSRSKSTYNGELIFDNKRGTYSINQVARMLNVPAQKVYYATRSGHMNASRKGAAWVVHVDEVNRYRKEYLDRRLKRAHAAS